MDSPCERWRKYKGDLQRGSAEMMVTLGVGDGTIGANLPHYFGTF